MAPEVSTTTAIKWCVWAKSRYFAHFLCSANAATALASLVPRDHPAVLPQRTEEWCIGKIGLRVMFFVHIIHHFNLMFAESTSQSQAAWSSRFAAEPLVN